MKFSGYLSEYSLAEIFNFVHESRQTGLLTLFSSNNLSTSSSTFVQYLWFKSGQLIALTTGLNGEELFTKILQRKLVDRSAINFVNGNLQQLVQPLGLVLKSQGLIDAGQIKLLFNSQTLVPIYKLFESDERRFLFEPNKLPMNSEMTGISSSAQDVALMGLRLLKNWSGLSSKLPDPNYAVKKCYSHQPNFELSQSELKLWTLADGKTPLIQLASKMGLSIDIVRQISFRLSIFRAIEEVPVVSHSFVSTELTNVISDPQLQIAPISNSFLGNLKKFLVAGRHK